MYGYIYKTTNLKNGKIYIGQHKSVKFDANYYGSGIWFKKVFQANGKDNFRCEIVEECASLEELNDREVYWIEYFQSRNPDIGYNLAKGGEQIYGGCTDQEKRLISMRILKATPDTVYDEINELRKFGLRIYETDEIWEPTSTNSGGQKMRASDVSVIVSFYTKRQMTITRRYAEKFHCSFWKYNLMVEISKIPMVFQQIKQDCANGVVIPETFSGPGAGTTGVFLETKRGLKSARMSIEFDE